jgi:hypothetical protein
MAMELVSVGMEYRITFYETERGARPVVEWLDELRATDPVIEKLVVSGLEKLRNSERHGPPLTEAIDSAPGMFELRVGKVNIARAFFFFRPGQEIVVTSGYVKKRRKLDSGELRRAVQYKDDWERRHP